MIETKIEIEQGKVVFGSTGFKNLIRNADDGSYMAILEPYKEEKTYQQIKFIHGPVVKAYSDYTGETLEDAKFNLKKRFGVNRLVKDSRSGDTAVEVRSLGKYTKEQMQEFLDRVLHHLEYDCGFVVDAETRRQFKIDD